MVGGDETNSDAGLGSPSRNPSRSLYHNGGAGAGLHEVLDIR